MPVQPLARLKIGAALAAPASNSASMPGLMSICAISSTIVRLLCLPRRLSSQRGATDGEGLRAQPRDDQPDDAPRHIDDEQHQQDAVDSIGRADPRGAEPDAQRL